ncbi:MAG: hypothetical protein RMJ98_01380, partial [Myxococcales bacterium]|nr:hypothetical protein [Polyangiaceae bacterium]MDW8247939.1 hypothetical protein [Myxococcales bacterium]
ADTHIHSRNSIDSPMRLGERVRSIAAEHVEWAVSTDHNYITDFAPFIIENHLERFLFSSIGLEMTTLESGHFNGYPLSYQVGPVTHGSFQWGAQPPDVIFQRLRELGRFGSTNTLIQVNHPRDQILGYFSQYDRHGLTMEEIPATTLTTQLVKPSGPAFRKEPGNPASETTFSFNFDLLEVVNGKLFWEIRHYRSPEVLPPGEVPDNLPPPGTLLLEADGGDVAFPGVVDDWFNLLNLGYKFIGVGTGDSHSGDDEAGQFRTMVFVGKDDPQEVTELDMVQGLRSRRVLMTNGPMLDFYINDPVKGVMGQTLSTTEPSVQLHYKLSAAPWIRVDFLNIWRNGILAARINVDPNRDLAAQPLEDSITLELDQRTGSARDSWFVVEAISSTSMFPVVLPTELPPLVLTDAVASLAGPLGLGGDEFGSVRPAETFAVVPYALTNPVWITTEAGRDFQPPGVLSVEEQRSPTNDPGFQRIFDQQNAAIKIARKVPIKAESRPGELVQKKGRRRRTGLFYPDADNPYDWRKVLIRMGYGHGHSE